MKVLLYWTSIRATTEVLFLCKLKCVFSHRFIITFLISIHLSPRFPYWGDENFQGSWDDVVITKLGSTTHMTFNSDGLVGFGAEVVWKHKLEKPWIKGKQQPWPLVYHMFSCTQLLDYMYQLSVQRFYETYCLTCVGQGKCKCIKIFFPGTKKKKKKLKLGIQHCEVWPFQICSK